MPTLLVVDDDPMVLEVMHDLLDEPGRAVRTAATAAQALEVARATELSVALVDKNLGPDNGLELSRRLKALQPELEIILITGYVSIESAIEAVQIGAFDYLPKPISDFGALGLKIKSAVEKSALRRSQRGLLERLMEAEVRHRKLIDAMPDALLVYDVETGRIVEANAAAVALYGFQLDELLAKTISDLRVEPGTSAGPRRELQRRKNGADLLVEVSLTQFRHQNRVLEVQSSRAV